MGRSEVSDNNDYDKDDEDYEMRTTMMMFRMRSDTTKAAEHENAIPRWAERRSLMFKAIKRMMMMRTTMMMLRMREETTKAAEHENAIPRWAERRSLMTRMMMVKAKRMTIKR